MEGPFDCTPFLVAAGIAFTEESLLFRQAEGEHFYAQNPKLFRGHGTIANTGRSSAPGNREEARGHMVS